MIWLDGVEITANLDHAVPGSVGFEVVRIWILDRISREKRAQVGDLGPATVIIKAYHFIGDT
jgi:hypothetical protein